MITENQLNEAIAECNGQLHPNANTCIKLAAFYTIKNEMFPKHGEMFPNNPQIENGYSYTAPPGIADNTIDFDSDSEFAKAVNGRKTNEVMAKLDEVMTGLYVVNPPLYRRIMRDMTE